GEPESIESRRKGPRLEATILQTRTWRATRLQSDAGLPPGSTLLIGHAPGKRRFPASFPKHRPRVCGVLWRLELGDCGPGWPENNATLANREVGFGINCG